MGGGCGAAASVDHERKIRQRRRYTALKPAGTESETTKPAKVPDGSGTSTILWMSGLPARGPSMFGDVLDCDGLIARKTAEIKVNL